MWVEGKCHPFLGITPPSFRLLLWLAQELASSEYRPGSAQLMSCSLLVCTVFSLCDLKCQKLDNMNSLSGGTMPLLSVACLPCLAVSSSTWSSTYRLGWGTRAALRSPEVCVSWTEVSAVVSSQARPKAMQTHSVSHQAATTVHKHDCKCETQRSVLLSAPSTEPNSDYSYYFE